MSKQMRTSHGEAEVFVLPPNLLEKLGINLHNITQNGHQLQEPKKRKKSKNLSESYSNHEGINSDSKSQKKHEESCLLETANLMKKSVFLSPTSIPLVVNDIPGEVEIVSNVESSMDLSNYGEINVKFITNDNNFKKDIVKRNVELEQPGAIMDSTTGKKGTSMIYDRNGFVPKNNKKKENDFYNAIQNNNFDVTESSYSNKEKCIKNDLQMSITSPTMNNNLYSTNNSHTSTILCETNSDINCKVSADNIQNNTSGILMDTLVSNKKYFINNNSALEIDEALIIPLSMATESTSNINLNDINGDAEDINIDIFRSLNGNDTDNLENAKKQKQNHENYKSTEIHNNDVNIDIIKYTECDDCSDMELENMLHETEILVPNTNGLNSSHNEAVNVINEKVNHTNGQQDVNYEHDLCDSIEENKILISILPELMNTSSLDILCGHNISNGIDIGCEIQNQKLMLPISITSESVENIQTNEINVVTTTDVVNHETFNKSDIQLDNILKEPVFIPLPLLSESINNDKIKVSHMSDPKSPPPFSEASVVQNESKDVGFPLSRKPSDIREKDLRNSQISENIIIATHNDLTETPDSLRGSSNELEVYNKKNNAEETEFKEKTVDMCDVKLKVQYNNVYFDSGIDEKNKSVNKTQYAKNDKEKSEETQSLQKQLNLCNAEKSNCLNIEKYDTLQNHCEDHIIEEKVHEIAECLKQAIQNNSKRIYRSGRGVKILKPKHGSPIKSKIFIQGVEKPGGSDEYDISFDKVKINKTYERKKERVNLHLAPIIKASSLKNVTMPEENKIEINTCIEQSHSTKQQEFCLCGDFGKFTFVDNYDSLYEHIHFGSNTSVNCPVGTVFEIYSDEKYIVNNIEEREYTSEKDSFSEYEDCHICWQKFEYQDNKIDCSEMHSSKHNKCVKDIDLKTDVSLIKSNSPMIQLELETANISEMITTKIQDKDICDNNIVSNESSGTSLTEIIVEVNCEVMPSLNRNLSTPTAHIHIDSEEKEDNKQQQSCGSTEESMDIQVDKTIHVDIESKENNETKTQPSCRGVDESTEIAPAEFQAFHIEIVSKENNDTLAQPSCRGVDESTENSAAETIHDDIESKETNDTISQLSCRGVDESTEIATAGKRKINKHTEEPPTKKSVKCGVCQQVFSKSEWDDHVSKVHCYIAWKEGETFDYDNLLLLKNLKKRLKRESLVCSLCSFKTKKIEKFLSHVKKCAVPEVLVSYKNDRSKKSKKTAGSSKSDKSKCGVCHLEVDDANWIEHISKQHHYLAWKDGDTPLNMNDEDEVSTHLLNLVKTYDHLICTKCGLLRKYTAKSIKHYLLHIKKCRNNDADESRLAVNRSSREKYEPSTKKSRPTSSNIYKCAVCSEEVDASKWYEHIGQQHNYRAWRDGDEAPDFEDKDVLWEHLNEISKKSGGLQCSKCGLHRRYVKPFLQHTGFCQGEEQEIKGKRQDGRATGSQVIPPYEWAECGACKQTMQINQWINHIKIMHNYVAWKQGQAPIKNAVHAKKRLQTFIDRLGHLDCSKCGDKIKDVDLYLEHVEACKKSNENETEDDETTMLAREGFYKCALCSEKIKYGNWREHSQSKHYIVAWVIGDEPIDVFNQNLIAKFMKEYQQFGGEFVCKVCGISRTSGLGFFAHIISCGLSEEQSDRFKMTCEICNAKHPGIYKSQHMTVHTQQELVKQRKEMAEDDREKEKQRKLDELVTTSGRRRAAEKARIVIKESVGQCKYVCQPCSFATDIKEDMVMHKCPKKRKLSDDMDSLSQQEESSDEDDFLEIDEEVEEEEECPKPDKRKRPDNSSGARIRIPFVVSNVQGYIKRNVNDYIKTYLTKEILFPEWIKSRCEAVLGDEVREFMPRLEESCQVHHNGNWNTYKRWEAVHERQGTILFTGASVHRISWLPALGSAEVPPVNMLAVACHSGADFPQYLVDDLPEHKALIQFWDFADFKITPKLVFGLGLQHGTVWGMDWCPSGAQEPRPAESHEGFVRMGLLAVACSNGMAYIYSVPYPSSVVSGDSVIHKLKPVAQLKFTMKSDRKIYQATSICWSQQKGHNTVIVGYSDGSTAYYDLKTESPFLKSQENDVTIFYPFYDEKTSNGTITDMDSFPIARASSVAGAVCMSSPTGSVLSSRGGSARCGIVRSHLASACTKFLPAWPSALLAGEDVVTNLTPGELDYWGMGRRVGFLQNCCGCQHCAVVATYISPFLRTMRPHHVRSELRKQVIAWIGIKQLAKKRKHNEEKSATKMEEALSYEEAVATYGLQFKLVHKVHSKDVLKKAMSQYKEVNPECFPLAEVPSMAFCPSEKHHRQVAVATHAGLIFVLQV